MPKLKSEVAKTLPVRIGQDTDYAVLYIRAGDNFDAIDCANQWAQAKGFERARELTLGRAKLGNEQFYVARCYRLAPGER